MSFQGCLVDFVRIAHFSFTNSVGPDQTPQHAASDQGLPCLPMYILWDTTYTWVNAGFTETRLILICYHFCLYQSGASLIVFLPRNLGSKEEDISVSKEKKREKNLNMSN